MSTQTSDEMETRIQEGKARTEESRSKAKTNAEDAITDPEASSSKDRADMQQRLYKARGESERADDRLGQLLDNARTRDADAAANPKGFFARIMARFSGGR